MHPGEKRDGARFGQTQSRIARMIRMHYPANQALKMMMKPLRLPNFLSAMIQPMVTPVALLVRQVLLR